MALLRQKKKQNTAKRAWRNFTNMIKSKLRDMEIAASIRESTNRFLGFLSRRIIIPFRTRYLQNTTYSDVDRFYSRDQTSRRFLSCFSRPPTKTKRRYVYDDDRYSQNYKYQSQLFSEGTSGISREKATGKKEEEDEGMPEIADSMEDAWRRVVAASPHLQVNERADEFIYKFRNTMKMEKERSFLEYQERLKRSA